MRIDHIAIYCKELDSVRDFFVKYFDAHPGSMYHNPKTGLKTYFLSFTEGSTRLELMSRPDVTADSNVSAHFGYAHMSFCVGRRENVDVLTQRLDDDGFAVLSGPRTTGDGYYESCVEGPEHILIEITE